MTKLIIQIPCYNEEATLGITLDELPRSLPGIDEIEWLVINDGSIDKTVEVAKAAGVNHVVSFERNRGLAKAFMAGIEASLQQGADIIVNTDADNQYCAADIIKLVEPIIHREADMVIGTRPIAEIPHFSPLKKQLQKFGSWVVRVASNTDVIDAPSGFRAITREAALRLNLFNQYTYTLETIIQAGRRGIRVVSVPIRVNGELRPSRLIKSIPIYIQRSIFTIVRIFMVYSPLRFFAILGSVPFLVGALLWLRWLWLYLAGTERSHVPSLVVAAVLLLGGLQLWIVGLVAELLAANRMLLEDIQLRVKRAELEKALKTHKR